MASILNKKSKDRLKKVILVLYDEYKHVKIEKNLRVVLSKYKYWLPRILHKRTKVSYELLTMHYLPKKLTMLKYDNLDFLGSVIEDVTSVRLKNEDVINYFYTEIVKIKYPHIFRQVSLPALCTMKESKDRKITINVLADQLTPKKRKIKWVSMYQHPLYFERVVIGAVILFVITFILVKYL